MKKESDTSNGSLDNLMKLLKPWETRSDEETDIPQRVKRTEKVRFTRFQR